MSSHLLSEVEQICDRLAIVIKGRVARVGTLAELLEAQDRFVITAKGIDALMFEGTPQNGFIKITVPALTPSAQQIEKIWLVGGEVIAVNPIRRTLEDLFVELANQNGGGHAAPASKQEPQDEDVDKNIGIVLLVLARLCPLSRADSGVENQHYPRNMGFRRLIAPLIFAGHCTRG